MVLGGTGGQNWNRILKKLGSDLVVQSSRQGYPEQNFALYHLGMVPGGKVFMGARQGRIFVFLGSSAKSLQNVLKIIRKATEIIEKSTENQLTPKKTNGF